AYGEETHDFGMNNLTLDGNRDATTGKVDGWFNGYIPGSDGKDSNVTLDSVEIVDCSGYGFDPHEQTVTTVIKNSVSHGNGLDGNRDATTGKVDGWFNGYIPGSDGKDSTVTLDSVEIVDCSGYGFDPHEQTVNMVIKNSVSHGNGLDGFVADFLSNSVFENNVAYNNDRHGFNVVTSTNDFTLANNVAYGNGSTGIVVQ